MSPAPSACPAVSVFPTGMSVCRDRSTPHDTYTVTPTGRSAPHNKYTVTPTGSYLVGKTILILCAISAISAWLQVQSLNDLSTEAAGMNEKPCSEDIH